MINVAQGPVTLLGLFPIINLAADSPNNLFNENKPYKRWIDPNPVAATEIPGFGKLAKYSAYRLTPENKPERFDYFLPLVDAATTNLPPAGWFGAQKKAEEVTVPMRRIETGETLVFDAFGGLLVRNDALWAATQSSPATSNTSVFIALSDADRATLQAIFNKVNDVPGFDELWVKLANIETLLGQVLIKLGIKQG